MNTEQERAEFEAWFTKTKAYISDPKDIFAQIVRDIAWEAWQAGRAALQYQDHPNRQGGVMDKLFCDLNTDEEKAAFFLSGRGYETGVISQAIQNDVAMAYHRCVEYKKELEALQSQDREDALEVAATLATVLHFIPGNEEPELYRDVERMCAEFSDHARRIEGGVG